MPRRGEGQDRMSRKNKKIMGYFSAWNGFAAQFCSRLGSETVYITVVIDLPCSRFGNLGLQSGSNARSESIQSSKIMKTIILNIF